MTSPHPRRRTKRPTALPRDPKSRGPRTLAIDIGGTGIKAIILDEAGVPVTERRRVATPKPATPAAVLQVIGALSRAQGHFDRVSVGFPGVIRQGVVQTAPNLDPSWRGFPLVSALSRQCKRPVRAANDADIQGYGVIHGQGTELVLTLGTGFGSALFVDGKLVPNLELAHHPFRHGHTYEEQLGIKALKKVGKKAWNARLAKAIDVLGRVLNFDALFIGGGNNKKVTLSLPPHIRLVPNIAGLLGGIAIWRLGAEPIARGEAAKTEPRTKGTAKRRQPSRRSAT